MHQYGLNLDTAALTWGRQRFESVATGWQSATLSPELSYIDYKNDLVENISLIPL